MLNPKGTISSAKRFVERRYDEVASEIKAVSYDVIDGRRSAVVSGLSPPKVHDKCRI